MQLPLRLRWSGVGTTRTLRRKTTRPCFFSWTASCREDLSAYLAGWKAYFWIAETQRVLAGVDKWGRHCLRALQLKHWKRGTVI